MDWESRLDHRRFRRNWRELCQLIGQRGDKLALTALPNEDFGSEESGSQLVVPGDIASEKTRVEVVDETVERFGRIDSASSRHTTLAVGVIVALAGIAMAVVLPQYGISSAGEWKGVFGHKNPMSLSLFYLFSGRPFCNISSGRRLEHESAGGFGVHGLFNDESRSRCPIELTLAFSRKAGRSSRSGGSGSLHRSPASISSS